MAGVGTAGPEALPPDAAVAPAVIPGRMWTGREPPGCLPEKYSLTPSKMTRPRAPVHSASSGKAGPPRESAFLMIGGKSRTFGFAIFGSHASAVGCVIDMKATKFVKNASQMGVLRRSAV